MKALIVFGLVFLILGIVSMVVSLAKLRGTDSLMGTFLGELMVIVGLVLLAGAVLVRWLF